jgi:NADH-quinone oxidoreductase subunit E
MTNTATDSALRNFEKVSSILQAHQQDPEKLIPILHAVQQEYRFLPEPVLIYVANALDLSPARVFGVATFFAHFALKPKGKYVVRVCDGTACHVKGSINNYDTVRKALALRDGQTTTDDLLFTLETVSCLGACGLAPVMMINEDVYGQLTEEKVASVLAEVKKRETKVAAVVEELRKQEAGVSA